MTIISTPSSFSPDTESTYWPSPIFEYTKQVKEKKTAQIAQRAFDQTTKPHQDPLPPLQLPQQAPQDVPAVNQFVHKTTPTVVPAWREEYNRRMLALEKKYLTKPNQPVIRKDSTSAGVSQVKPLKAFDVLRRESTCNTLSPSSESDLTPRSLLSELLKSKQQETQSLSSKSSQSPVTPQESTFQSAKPLSVQYSSRSDFSLSKPYATRNQSSKKVDSPLVPKQKELKNPFEDPYKRTENYIEDLGVELEKRKRLLIAPQLMKEIEECEGKPSKHNSIVAGRSSDCASEGTGERSRAPSQTADLAFGDLETEER